MTSWTDGWKAANALRPAHHGPAEVARRAHIGYRLPVAEAVPMAERVIRATRLES